MLGVWCWEYQALAEFDARLEPDFLLFVHLNQLKNLVLLICENLIWILAVTISSLNLVQEQV